MAVSSGGVFCVLTVNKHKQEATCSFKINDLLLTGITAAGGSGNRVSPHRKEKYSNVSTDINICHC